METPLQQFEESHPADGVLRRCGRMLRRLVESRWQLPLGAAGFLVTGAVIMRVVAELSLMMGEAPRWIECIFDIGWVLFLTGVLGGLMVPFWLVIMTLVWINREDLWESLCCWAASAAAAVIAYLTAVWLAFNMPHDAPIWRDSDYNPPEQERTGNRM